MSGSARKSFHARFDELVGALDKLGLNPSSLYHRAAVGEVFPEDNDADKLRPYRPLDAARIVLHGRGSRGCLEYL